MRFSPKASDEITIFLNGRPLRFRFVPHPDPSYLPVRVPHAMDGERSTVYRVEHLQPGGAEYALKVMTPRYRDSVLGEICAFLRTLDGLGGLAACDRICLTGDIGDQTFASYPDLQFAILMPWIKGTSWFDAHQLHGTTQAMSRWQCWRVARAFASVLVSLEQRELAHCALSPYNVIVSPDCPLVELVGVESMYGPHLNSRMRHGTIRGYRHRADPDSERNQYSDRFSGALLVAELLAWYEPAVAENLYSAEYYFDPEELQLRDSERFAILVRAVEGHHRDVGSLLRRAWGSSSQLECPSFSEWLATIDRVTSTKIAYAWILTAEPVGESSHVPRCWSPAMNDGSIVF